MSDNTNFNPRLPLDVLDFDFLRQWRGEIEESVLIVEEHSSDGENQTFSISQMFPHGIQDITYEIFKKACRAVGYELKGNYDKVRMELQDIVNYAGFALTYLTLHERYATYGNSTDTPDAAS